MLLIFIISSTIIKYPCTHIFAHFGDCFLRIRFLTWNCWVKEVLLPKIPDARCRAHLSEAGSHWHCLCRPPGCPPSAPRSPSGGSEGWAQKARWLLLTPRRSQEAPATGALAGKQTQSGREWTSPFQPLSWAGQGRPGSTGGCGLQLPAALRTASISRECCFSTASRLIHGISPFPYNVYVVLEHTGSAMSAGYRCTATCAISYLSDSARLPSGQCPGRNCIPPGLVC